jgi:beta-glucosidase
VVLQPGEEKETGVDFGRQGAAYWDKGKGQFKVAQGKAKVLLATSLSSGDVEGQLEVDVEVHF